MHKNDEMRTMIVRGICKSSVTRLRCMSNTAERIARGHAWGGDFWGPKKKCIRWGSRFPHGFDAAFANLLWLTCYILCKLCMDKNI